MTTETAINAQHMASRACILGLLLAGLCLLGCASSEGPVIAAVSSPPPPSFAPYEGPQRRVQVVEISVRKSDLEHYPELADKRVGFGMSKLLVESLFDSGRFKLLEEKAEILRRLVEQWELKEGGILVGDPVGDLPELEAPEFLVYAELFDFVACSPSERLIGTTRHKSCVTSVGVQVRVNNARTGEYIPGSTDPLMPEGQYIHNVDMSLFGKEQQFDQSAVGKATARAIQVALVEALGRFDKAGW